jgi:hypothetical protein
MTKIAGSGPRIRIHAKMSWIRNTAFEKQTYLKADEELALLRDDG